MSDVDGVLGNERSTPMNKQCEIADCDRDGITDITATQLDGSPGELIVCQPCYYAFNLAKNDPNV